MFSATVKSAYAIVGRGTHLLIDIDEGRVAPGDVIRVELLRGDRVEVTVSEIEIVELPLAGGLQPRCALLVPDLDPTEIVVGAEVTTAREWDGNTD